MKLRNHSTHVNRDESSAFNVYFEGIGNISDNNIIPIAKLLRGVSRLWDGPTLCGKLACTACTVYSKVKVSKHYETIQNRSNVP